MIPAPIPVPSVTTSASSAPTRRARPPARPTRVAVGVVVDDRRHARALRRAGAASGTSCMRRRCGPMCSVPGAVDEPGHADADRRPASAPSDAASSSSVSTRPVAAVGGRARAPRPATVAGCARVDGHAEHLGAADVEPDRDAWRQHAPAERGSVAEQRADAAEHVEVGVADADRDRDALGERLLDGVLDDVVDPLHRRAGVAGAWARPRASAPVSGQRQPSWAKPFDTTSRSTRCSTSAVERAGQARRRRGGRWRRPPSAGRRGPPPGARSTSASTASAAASTSAGRRPTADAAIRPHSRSRRYGCRRLLELAGDGVGRADGEVVEARGPATGRRRPGRRGAGAGGPAPRGGAPACPARARRGCRSRAGSSSSSSERSTSRPSSNTYSWARCLSASSTPIGSCSCTIDSSWPDGGRVVDHQARAHRLRAAR